MSDAHRHHGHDAGTVAKPGYPQHPELRGEMAHTVPGAPARAEPPGGHVGHDKHAGHSVAMLRDKFWISLLLTIPTLLWGHMLPRVLGYTPPAIPGAHWIAPVFGTVVFGTRRTRWLRDALHSLDYPFLNAHPTAWRAVLLALLAGGGTSAVTGVVLALRRIRRR